MPDAPMMSPRKGRALDALIYVPKEGEGTVHRHVCLQKGKSPRMSRMSPERGQAQLDATPSTLWTAGWC